MIDIFARIYLGILIFLSAAAIIALIVCFIAAMIWLIVEVFKDIFG